MAQAKEQRASTGRYIDRDGNKAEHYGNHRQTGWQDNNLRYPRSVWQFAQRSTAFEKTTSNHPTEKPLPLMRRLVEIYSRPGDVVLDCFCGSGSTALAALGLGRQFLASDNDAAMVEVARARLASFDPLEAREFDNGFVQHSLFEGMDK